MSSKIALRGDMMDNKIMKKKEVAEMLMVSVATIDRWRKEGLPCVQLGERTLRFESKSVQEWFDKKKDN